MNIASLSWKFFEVSNIGVHKSHRFCISNGDSQQKSVPTLPKSLFKGLNMNILIPCSQVWRQWPGLACLASWSPAQLFSSTPGCLQHHFPLPVLKLSFRPIARVMNRVIIQVAGCWALGPMGKESIWIQHLSLFSLLFSVLFSVNLNFHPDPSTLKNTFKQSLQTQR